MFKLGSKTLDDPGVDMTPEEVMDFFSAQFPSLVNAGIETEGPDENGVVTYTFTERIGKHG